MGEWKRVKLGNLIRIKHGYAFPGTGITSNDNGKVLVTPGNFNIGGGFKESGKKFFSGEFPPEYCLAGGDLIVTMTDLSKASDTLGYSAIVPTSSENQYLHNQRIGLVSIVDEMADRNFIYWLMRTPSYHQEVVAGASGTTVKHTSPSRIYDVEVDIPALPTQRRIAAVLGALDDKIEVNRKICENLEAQAQALFKAWFVDFEPFGGKRPVGWQMGKLGDVGEIVGGATPSKAKSEYYTDDGISWITPKDISLQGTKFIAKGEVDVTEKGFKSASVKLMPRGSVLFSSRAPIGYVAVAQNDICTNQGFKSVVPKDGIGTCFVYEFLKLNKQLVEDRASGSTFKEISTAGMRDIPIMIPDVECLKRFETSAWPLFLMQENKEGESRALAAMRDALLPKLISGELAVEKVEV